jgi:hypothetical protein
VNQLTAEYIEIHTQNSQIKTMYLNKASFIISKADSAKFNQIKGKNMVCHFKDNELYRVDVNGNGQTVYYPPDDDEVIGVNKIECSDLIIFLKEGKVNTITFLKKPDAVLYPMEQAPINELILKGFQWFEGDRPKTKMDIFN